MQLYRGGGRFMSAVWNAHRTVVAAWRLAQSMARGRSEGFHNSHFSGSRWIQRKFTSRRSCARYRYGGGEGERENPGRAKLADPDLLPPPPLAPPSLPFSSILSCFNLSCRQVLKCASFQTLQFNCIPFCTIVIVIVIVSRHSHESLVTQRHCSVPNNCIKISFTIMHICTQWHVCTCVCGWFKEGVNSSFDAPSNDKVISK